MGNGKTAAIRGALEEALRLVDDRRARQLIGEALQLLDALERESWATEFNQTTCEENSSETD